ncbi:hypothetical protein [Streptomyces sp. bgisy104]|uniref:hypothetical protein n=2 Tax=unclassified Streptomyces TaxID=2593676 RepID=UPI003EBD86C5
MAPQRGSVDLVSVGGAGIPRLHELMYIETAAKAVARGEPFERIRLAMVDQAEQSARRADQDGSFDPAKWVAQRSNPSKYVHNTVDVLKELMRLGWVERHVLPSSPRSAYAHAHVTFEVTDEGRSWTQLVERDPRMGYNALVGKLLEAHPQFEGFLRLVGARPDSTTNHLTVPLLKYEGSSYENHDEFLRAFVAHVTEAVQEGDLGWTAEPDIVRMSLHDYVNTAVRRAKARAAHRAQTDKQSAGGRRKTKRAVEAPRNPPGADLTRKRVAALCEEAVVRLAFTSAGCSMDYISHELLRRWCRFLGLANFSYYAPGPQALRLWATGRVSDSGEAVTFQRQVGSDVRHKALLALPRIWRDEAGRPGGTMYRPVWQVRAAVCWDQRISDEEFDAALAAAYRGEVPDLEFGIHLDEASLVRIPGSARPFSLKGRVFHVMRLDETYQEVGATAS